MVSGSFLSSQPLDRLGGLLGPRQTRNSSSLSSSAFVVRKNCSKFGFHPQAGAGFPPLRWVDKVQVAPPLIIERKPEASVWSRGLVWLAFLATVLTVAIIEVLFRGTRSV